MMTPLGLVLTLGLALLVFSLSRTAAAVCIIATVCYLTEGMPLNVGVFHFTAIRFVLLAGLIRVLSRGESSHLRLNVVDRTLIIYALAIAIIATLRVGALTELVYQVGGLYNVFLAYFVFRSLLRDERDYCDVLAKTAYVIIPFACLIVFESFTHRNLFSVFGEVGEYSWVRDGHVRSEGPFRNPITAGAFGATFAMLFASMLFARVRIRPALVGVVASTVIVMCAHSSGPFLGLAIGLLSMACWPWRRQTRSIRWGIIAVLVGLQLVMKAPVWFLIARVSDIFGGGGYHRAFLIDTFFRRFGSWWLAGITDTSDWFPYQLFNGEADITNRFVADGVSGGLVGLILSVTLVVRCFQQIGVAIRANRGYAPATEKLCWGIGSTLVGSVGILFSVTYFDQMGVIWYFLLTSIAGADIRKKGPLPGRSGSGRVGVAGQVRAAPILFLRPIPVQQTQ